MPQSGSPANNRLLALEQELLGRKRVSGTPQNKAIQSKAVQNKAIQASAMGSGGPGKTPNGQGKRSHRSMVSAPVLPSVSPSVPINNRLLALEQELMGRRRQAQAQAQALGTQAHWSRMAQKIVASRPIPPLAIDWLPQSASTNRLFDLEQELVHKRRGVHQKGYGRNGNGKTGNRKRGQGKRGNLSAALTHTPTQPSLYQGEGGASPLAKAHQLEVDLRTAQAAQPRKKRRFRTQAQAFDLGEPIQLRCKNPGGHNAGAPGHRPPRPSAVSLPPLPPPPPPKESVPLKEPVIPEALSYQVEAFETPQPGPSRPQTPSDSAPVTVPPMPLTDADMQQDIQSILHPSPPASRAAPIAAATRSPPPISPWEPSASPKAVPPKSSSPPPASLSPPATKVKAPEQDQRPANYPPPPPPPPQYASPSSRKMSHAHAIFDRLENNMAYANAFDLGTVSLDQRFDEFDRILDEKEKS